MLCVNNALYLAFQNLKIGTFDSAPDASIAVSTDHGTTWQWNTQSPMFANSVFTTIFFLDYGKNYANSPDGYVYAYGLDNNWRFQQKLYLGRVAKTSIQSAASWQFYQGSDGNGNPVWGSISTKQPVLTDNRVLYANNFCSTTPELCPSSPIGQGGVVYDAPLHRYIFSSWSTETHEFYEAPTPWGPWSHFLSQDFGALLLQQNRGQYGISIPSKFLSGDGKTLYVQSNVCCQDNAYTFSLRKLYVEPYAAATASNVPDNNNNIAVTGAGTTAISKSTHLGTLCGLNCSDSLNDRNTSGNEDDYDQEVKPTDWWGYTWNHPYNMNKVTYTTGTMFTDGGWYTGNLQVQVRQNFNWINVPGVSITPSYPYSNSAGNNKTYTFTFGNTWGDGVRIIGSPGGSAHFTSISELGVYYAGGGSLVQDGGFENQTSGTVSAPWNVEGDAGAQGIDINRGFAHSGNNNAWIRTSGSNWNAVTQTISVQPNTNYQLSGWIINNFASNQGYFGVRNSNGVSVLQETSFTALPQYSNLTVKFNSGNNTTITVYGGFWGKGTDYWMRLDDISLVSQ
jgi:hypothetical protein